MPILLLRPILRRLLAAAAAAAPAEACGVLLGPGGAAPARILAFAPLTNRAAATGAFALDPREFLAVEAAGRRQGLAVLGTFHSHPHAGPLPSALDLEMAWPGHLLLIAGRTRARRWRLAAWRAAAGGTSAQRFTISTSSTSKTRIELGGIEPLPLAP
ncbi:MAG: Mov34/MPN/PAD-1 family protein [Planctomycetes bacterium]|nr:Mov34/MPN/PAD-1 family protein [Planctomycetota bacterium]